MIHHYRVNKKIKKKGKQAAYLSEGEGREGTCVLREERRGSGEEEEERWITAGVLGAEDPMKQSSPGRRTRRRGGSTPATLTHGTLALNKAIIIEFSLNEEDGGK